MKIKLRPYQKEAIELLRQGFREHKRQILCLPTGAGKTVIFSEMCRLAVERGTKVLVLTDRKELFLQTFNVLSRVTYQPNEITAEKRLFDVTGLLSLAMVETYARRKLKGYTPELIVIDEAHKGNFTKIIERHPDSFVIGATATPVGKHIPKYYTNIVAPIDIPELIRDGYLSPCHPYQMKDDFSDLEMKRGEFTEQSLFAHFNKRKLYLGVVEEWSKLALNKKTIVFNVNIEHAERMTEEFNAAGITSYCVTSKTPKEERTKILMDFKAGKFPVLNNCGILTTGYDEPSIECVIMNRKTASLPLWLQCCGRGSRIYPGKDEFIVLDFGENHKYHGLWHEPRTWTLEQKRKKKKQAAPVKECPKCAAMLHAAASECKFCGHKFPPPKQEIGVGKMVEVGRPLPFAGKRISELSVDELIELQNRGEYKPSFIWRVVRSRGEGALTYYGRKMKYKKGWYFRQLGLIHDCKFSDFVVK